MVEKEEIMLLATEYVYAYSGRVGYTQEAARIRETCGWFFEANKASVVSRYDMPVAEMEFKGNDVEFVNACEALINKYSVVQKIKLVNHFSYQCSDANGWETSVAKQKLDGVLHRLIEQLPGYAVAEWGM